MKAVEDAARYRNAEVNSMRFLFRGRRRGYCRKTTPAIRYFIPGVIHRGAKGLIVAAPKAGKSVVGLDLGVALPAGLPWMGGIQPSAAARVGICSREDGPGMTMYRIQQLAMGRGLDFKALPGLYVNTCQQRSAFSIESEANVDDICRWDQA